METNPTRHKNIYMLKNGKYHVLISHNNNQYDLGRYKNLSNAIKIRDEFRNAIRDGKAGEWSAFKKTNNPEPNKYVRKKQPHVLIGKEIGKLKVKDIIYEGKRPYAICDCSCGNANIKVRTDNIESGITKSCGCLRKEGKKHISEHKHISYSNGLWVVHINFFGELRYLGSYKKLEKAITIRDEALKVMNEARSNNNEEILENWVENNIKLSYRKNVKNGIYKQKNGKYMVKVKNHYLGIYDNIGDATKIRDEAKQASLENRFEEWHEEYKKGKFK